MKNCMFCGARRSLNVKSDKKGKPFLSCESCSSIMFPRGRAGLRLVEVWDQLLSLVPDAKLMEFQLAADAGQGVFALLARLPSMAETVRAAAATSASPAAAPAPAEFGGVQ